MTIEDTSAELEPVVSEEDIAPISTASSPEALQRVMDVARAGAEAQAELEEAGVDPNSPADPEYSDETEDDEGEDEGELEQRAEQGDQPRYSRRDAARLARELEQLQNDVARTRGELHARQANDATLMRQIAEQAGSDAEFEQLRNTVRRTPQQQERFETMAQWRAVAGPIYRVAQEQVMQNMSGAFNAAAELGGMTPEMHQQLLRATDAKKALELVHQAGVKTAAAEIARLKAEVSSLKTQVTAGKPQPAAPEGLSGAASPRLPSMLLDDGSLNPEFEKLAKSGRLYGVERLSG